MSRPALPRVVVALVEWLVPDPVAREGLLGDLAERHAYPASRGGWARGAALAAEVASLVPTWAARRTATLVETARQDLGFALRSMTRRPGFSALVVATLALGIGSNTAIFSVVDGLLLEPLPFPEAERLVVIDELEESGFTASVSFPNYRDWKERARSFEHFSISLPSSRRFVAGGSATILEVAWVAGGYFETLGVEPLLGRWFDEAESEPGGERLVVISHGLWSEAFGADPGVLGRAIELGDDAFTVVGVARPDFVLDREVSAFLPLGVVRDVLPWDDRRSSVGAAVVARIAPDRSLAQARAELAAIGAAIEQETGESTGIGRATPLRERLVGDTGRQSLILLAAVGLVLLIACVNVANLLFVASERRKGEIALRTALGAGAGRIHRQLLTEALLVGAFGGLAGLALGWAGVRGLVGLVGDALPYGFADRIGVDGRVIAFTCVIALATSILAGFLPAFRAAGTAVAHRLRAAAPGSAGSGRARGVLVASEVALSMILLVGAGLLIATLGRLQRVEKGFDSEGILTLRLQTPDDVEESREMWADFHDLVRERIGGLPGVRSVATSNHFPLSGNSWEMLYRDEQTPADDRGESVLLTMVSPSFFDTWSVGLVEGRGFTDADRWGSELVAIVDETLAAARWPGESPLGRRITFEAARGPDGEEVEVWRTVVGVARHVRHYDLATTSRIEVYTPIAQSQAWGFTSYLSVRVDERPGELAAPIRALLSELEPDATLYRVRTAESIVEQELGVHRAMREVLGVMAALALFLGCVGIYSVVSHTTALRLRELSLRIALGSEPGRVTRLVLRDALAPIVAGLVVGSVGALGLGRLLRTVLYEVGPSDPSVFGSSAAILLLVAVASAWLPARRAGGVPPQRILRGEEAVGRSRDGSDFGSSRRSAPVALQLRSGLSSGRSSAPIGLELRAPVPGESLGLLATPLGDAGVVAGAEDVGHRVPAVLGRAGVRRCGEEAVVVEGVVHRRVVVSHGAGQEPHDGVGDRERADLATREDEVAERDLLCGQMIGHPLVDVLVVPAQERELGCDRQPHGVVVAERASAGGEEHDRTLGREVVDRLEERLGLHDHPGAAPVGDVVDGPVAVVRVLAQVDEPVLDQARFRGARRNRQPERALEEGGEDRDDVDPHHQGSSALVGRGSLPAPWYQIVGGATKA